MTAREKELLLAVAVALLNQRDVPVHHVKTVSRLLVALENEDRAAEYEKKKD